MSARLRITYRRASWNPATSNRFRRFDSPEAALAFLELLRRRSSDRILGKLEERDRSGRWIEIPIRQEGASR
jgi:hypothetical protein